MSRSVSQASDLSRAPHPSTTSSLFPANTMMDRLYQDDANAQLLGGHARHSTGRLPEVQEDPLPDCGQNPMDFIMSTEDDSASFASASYPGAYYAPHHTGHYFQYPANVLTSVSSSTPSLVSVDSAAIPETTPLTRDNSSVGESFVGAFELARLDSTNMSIARTESHDPFGRDFYLGSGTKQAAADGAYPVGSFAGRPAEYPDDADSAEMHRSSSNTSTRSTASNQERRAKEARERQILNSLRNNNIKPKPCDPTAKPTATLTPPALEASHSAGAKKDPVALGKTQYQRPKHPKIHCNQCNDQPDGFRGEHELRRHVLSKHADTVTKWVCREPEGNTGVAVVNPLSKCKACLGKKQYGAYYNAAAHLRRAHFRKRAARGRKGEREGESRAGKGGGDWPPMGELKHWMRKVQVRNNIIVGEGEEVGMDVGAGAGVGMEAAADIEFMTYGNGGALDYAGLDSAEYPDMLPELTVDTIDAIDVPAESIMPGAGGLSPFSSVSDMSPMQRDLSYDGFEGSFAGSHEMSPSMPYMEFSPVDEYGMAIGGV